MVVKLEVNNEVVEAVDAVKIGKRREPCRQSFTHGREQYSHHQADIEIGTPLRPSFKQIFPWKERVFISVYGHGTRDLHSQRLSMPRPSSPLILTPALLCT